MADYIFTFRCRFCGETYTGGVTSECIAMKSIYKAIYSNSGMTEAFAPNLLDVHTTDTHIGVADLIGCEIRGNNE